MSENQTYAEEMETEGKAGEVNLGGVRVSEIRADELEHRLTEVFGRGEGLILYANAQTYCLTVRHEWLMALNKSASIVFADGYGVLWAAKLMGVPLSDKIALTNHEKAISRAAINSEKKLFLLGGEPGISSLAAEKLRELFPELEIAGTHHGFFDKEGASNDGVIRMIRESGAGVLVVGFGSPLQEEWYKKNLNNLQDIVCIMGGNCLTYWAGKDKKPPVIMQKNGLAWLYRCFRQPGRMLPRYLRIIPEFILRILILKFRNQKQG